MAKNQSEMHILWFFFHAAVQTVDFETFVETSYTMSCNFHFTVLDSQTSGFRNFFPLI